MTQVNRIMINLAFELFNIFQSTKNDEIKNITLKTLQYTYDKSVELGEKLYEELMSQEETRRAMELEEYFVVLPAFRGIYRNINYDYPGIMSESVDKAYISEEGPFMTRKELKTFLKENNLLQIKVGKDEHLAERYWPGE